MPTLKISVFISIATEYIHHNTDKLSRIYPGGLRTDSSNYNPVPLWNAGCQIGEENTMHTIFHWETQVVSSVPDCNDAVFSLSSGSELPDAVFRDGSEPGALLSKRTERLHPKAFLPARAGHWVWPHHPHQRPVAEEKDSSCDGKVHVLRYSISTVSFLLFIISKSVCSALCREWPGVKKSSFTFHEQLNLRILLIKVSVVFIWTENICSSALH